MERIEEMIKNYLKKNLGMGNIDKTSDCLEQEVLLAYLQGGLSQERCKVVEHHLAGCGFCLNQLDVAHQAQLKSGEDSFEAVPQGLINKTKVSLGISTVKNNNKSKPIRRRFFLAGTVISFALSFIIPKYFIQFLVATLILGLRWAFESEGARTLIMVLDSRRHHLQDKDSEPSNRLKKHL